MTNFCYKHSVPTGLGNNLPVQKQTSTYKCKRRGYKARLRRTIAVSNRSNNRHSYSRPALRLFIVVFTLRVPFSHSPIAALPTHDYHPLLEWFPTTITDCRSGSPCPDRHPLLEWFPTTITTHDHPTVWEVSQARSFVVAQNIAPLHSSIHTPCVVLTLRLFIVIHTPCAVLTFSPSGAKGV